MARPALSPSQIESRRGDILDAAQALFEEQGLEAVSLRRIAGRAGCSPNTPYRVFPTKEHVLLGLRIRAYESVQQRLAAAAGSTPPGTAQLRAIAEAYVAFALARPATYALLFRVGEAAEDDPELMAAKRDALDVCRRAFTDAAEQGDVQIEEDALTAAHLFWAAAHGAVSLHLGGQLVMGRELEKIAPTLITTLMTGLSQKRGSA